MPLADLNTQAARDRAYTALEAAGTVPHAATDDEAAAALAAHHFYDVYAEPDPAVTTAATRALAAIGHKVGAMQAADLALDGCRWPRSTSLPPSALPSPLASWA